MSEQPLPWMSILEPPPAPLPPEPPRLHWGFVFGLSAITFGLFGMVWLFVQANWVKKVTGDIKPFGWTLAYLLYLPGSFFLGMIVAIFALFLGHRPEEYSTALQSIIRLCGLVLYIFAAYTLKGTLGARPFGIPLGGIMTFFFGPTYFQYHLQDFQWETTATTHAGAGLGLSRPMAPIVMSGEAGELPNQANVERPS